MRIPAVGRGRRPRSHSSTTWLLQWVVPAVAAVLVGATAACTVGAAPASAGLPSAKHTYTGVSAVSQRSVVVAGHRWKKGSDGGHYVGYILRSVNGGRTWSKAKLRAPGWRRWATEWDQVSIWGVDMATTRVGWAVGSTGGAPSSGGPTGWILKTADGGRTWKAQAKIPDAPRQIQAVSGKLLYLVTCGPPVNTGNMGCPGPAYRSTNGGRSWKKLTGADGLRLLMLSPTYGWLAGGSQNLLKTVDGTSFLPVLRWSQETRWGTLCVAAHDQERVWVGLNQGSVWGSSNGGDAWVDASVKDVPTLLDMQAVGPSFACAVGGQYGRGSAVLLYDGSGWSRSPGGNGLTVYLRDVEFVDVNTGWAVGDQDGTILHTTDGGKTWSKQ